VSRQTYNLTQILVVLAAASAAALISNIVAMAMIGFVGLPFFDVPDEYAYIKDNAAITVILLLMVLNYGVFRQVYEVMCTLRSQLREEQKTT